MSAVNHLSGSEFVELIRAGHARLRAHVDVVNSLNIFPVPDGDTGTNMELSLASGVKALQKRSYVTPSEVAGEFSTGLLMGARGNSGVILSQLFRGFIKATQRAQTMDAVVFANALYDGVQIAYQAVAKPVEGTILSVAKEAATVGVREAKHRTSLVDWFQTVTQAAQRALQKTPEQLPVLKQAGVVDSGGQGLVYIYEGFLQYLRGEHQVDEPVTIQEVSQPLDFAAAHMYHEEEFGYCTEVLVRVDDTTIASKTVDTLRETYIQYGDSLLVVGAENLVKVHVHTLHPGRVLEDALAHGELIKIKIENMTEQHADIQSQQNHRATVESKADVATPVKKDATLIAVAAGEGLTSIFESLGVDIVISGGQTMNPSTEEIVEAVRNSNGLTTIILPNNKNIVMAAEQAKSILGDSVSVVPTTNIPQGIAALMAYDGRVSAAENTVRMEKAIANVHSGQVVRAVRDSVYQDREIRMNQYLGFVNQNLICVGDDRNDVALRVVAEMGGADSELLTVFLGSELESTDATLLRDRIIQEFDIEVEMTNGGQPVYDYIFTLE